MKYYKASSAANIRVGPGTDYAVAGTVDSGQVVQAPDCTGWITVLLEDDTVGFISAKLLVEVAAPAAPAGGEPAWIALARKYLGTKEAAGSADNPTIVAWDKLMTTLPASMRHDSTPWCAIFVHAMLKLSGYTGKLVESAAAVDWLKFGTSVSTPELGDVVVFEWSSGGHHVAFVLSASGDSVQVIGGNQSDAVTIEEYPTENVLGYRRAS